MTSLQRKALIEYLLGFPGRVNDGKAVDASDVEGSQPDSQSVAPKQ